MRLAAILTFVAVVCGLAYYVLTHPSVEKLEVLRGELAQLEEQNEHLADKNRRLEREIVALRDDPRLAERRARERVGLARPDELIFQFETPEEAPRVRVRLRVPQEGEAELAGKPVEIDGLAPALAELRQEMPHAELVVWISEDVGPLLHQQIIDVVDASPMAPARIEE
ncbi:hypothetical protein DL240_14995 [Lujinxingia litoralis]|uniref:Septum formation initiator n=1 Tax=Lujinxingia litoralis TaxID=2211119 RepID=A0A328C2U4_9DELT|nr:septum formation initiator family protein [Lujinxingia litoralis]RAL20975.1 hypothetical protein DL240_14995 [Lujinxingia litoralis]